MLSGKDANQQSPEPVGKSAGSESYALGIIADDLTGACDAAAPFASLNDDVRVYLSALPNFNEAVWAISTESRDLPPSEADRRIADLSESLRESTEIFKKIDSVFRGNTATEIAAVLRYFRFDLALISPAYPILGRTVVDGNLTIEDAGGKRTLSLLDLLSSCKLQQLSAGLSIDSITSQLEERLRWSPSAILCDAENQTDLLKLVHAAKSLQKRILWIGSGGLAHAIASTSHASQGPFASSWRPGATIFFVGSPHAVTTAQVNHLRCVNGISEYSALSIPNPTADLLLSIRSETTDTEIRNALRHITPRSIGCLFMTGGETSSQLCRVLGIKTLLMTHEFAPGIPIGIAEGGVFDGVPVVLKSGGFGSPDLFCRISQHFASEPQEVQP